MRIICNNLKEIRKSQKLTQGQLAEMVGCSQGRIGDYESGRCTIENITLGVALKLSNALGCTIEDLFTMEAPTAE
ncbi:helix-turn-helix transcriptional regulator [Ruminococcus sp. XPD3002]|uniref:helix-turn-helix transcriptional regulator n=1 Tax=Ruminococcus sp. XPD3002 TaxID=1452269 RepID=UPI0009236290|nr:putative transcriptional regulator [Ruminococcus flavefaciens]HPY85538.1 helix-turn-helix transcriptional regulator [Ruminococcus flavefaciens]